MTLGVHIVRAHFRTREGLLIENLVLRQQVIALKKKRLRPQLDDMDRALWVALRAAWPDLANRLITARAYKAMFSRINNDERQGHHTVDMPPGIGNLPGIHASCPGLA